MQYAGLTWFDPVGSGCLICGAGFADMIESRELPRFCPLWVCENVKFCSVVDSTEQMF